MSSRIQVLDDTTINQIAAGEVVESPASVLKELMENSIDAKATRIAISIDEGGQKKIEVSDNGFGMSLEDVKLALQRHATSKIRSIEDMNSLQSMGFRGEALPSIASISHLTIKTSQRSEENVLGSQLRYVGGVLEHEESLARPPGTTLSIHSLFFNVPARLKFQKSARQDYIAITRVFCALALAHPQITFVLRKESGPVFHFNARAGEDWSTAFQRRSLDVLGKDFVKHARFIEIEKDNYSLAACLSLPTHTRSTRNGQHLFVNQRFIQSHELSRAIEEAYGTRIPIKRYPSFVLHLNLPPDTVDVNIHPQKKTLSITHLPLLKELLEELVFKAFDSNNPVPTELEEDNGPSHPLFPLSALHPSLSSSLDAPLMPQIRAAPSEPFITSYPQMIGTFDPYFLFDARNLPPHCFPGPLPEGKCIAFVHYKQARSRILYEELNKERLPQIASQKLLIPIHLEFPPREALLLQDCLTQLEELGFQLRSFGPDTFILESIPDIPRVRDHREFFLHFIDELPRREKIDLDSIRLALCQANFRRASFPNLEESRFLIGALLKCRIPYSSAKGEPCIHLLPLGNLGKMSV